MRSRPEVFTLGHSPDPDDAFMFYAIAENKIDLRGYRFEHQLEDIQTLNERALRGELHISAISIHAYAYIGDKYALLPCGASMGDGYGPIVIRKHPTRLRNATARQALNSEMLPEQAAQLRKASRAGSSMLKEDVDLREWLRNCTIAVPGRMTSAFLALQLYLGNFRHVVIPFDEIFDAVKSSRADAGLIIHEGQLTYAQSGFTKIVDLGEWWKRETGLPLPLGGNVLRKNIPPDVRHDLGEIIRKSIDYGLAHRAEAVRHSLPYARDMNVELAGKFIGMYVNDYTRDYGEVGRTAIRKFLGEAQRAGYIDNQFEIEFVE
jgi:5,8-dihydroxy-2-naphthoate synthase